MTMSKEQQALSDFITKRLDGGYCRSCSELTHGALCIYCSSPEEMEKLKELEAAVDASYRRVVLSTSMILEEGNFLCRKIELEEAQQWVTQFNPTNYVGHSTAGVVGLEPATSREQCEGYDEALVLKVMGRLEFGKEYSVEEILAIGVQPMLITKVN